MWQSGPWRKGNWWQRNWKRVVVAFIGLIGLTVILVFWTFNHSEAKRLAMKAAATNQPLALRLGQPITNGWFITGEIEQSAGFGKAELVIPLSGPKGQGNLYVRAVKEAAVWRLVFLQFGDDDDPNRIRLVDE